MSKPRASLLTDDYMSEDGELFFFPVGGWSWQQAQSYAKRRAQDEGGVDAKAVYLGKQPTQIHDHDEPWDDDECERVPAYVFELETP